LNCVSQQEESLCQRIIMRAQIVCKYCVFAFAKDNLHNKILTLRMQSGYSAHQLCAVHSPARKLLSHRSQVCP